MNGDAVRRDFRVDDKLFGLRVGCQLSRVDDHRSRHRRRASAPQRQQSFLPGDARQGVEDARVAPALFGRKSAVGRHPNQRDFGRRADEGADSAGRHADGGFGKESRRGVVFRRHFEQRLVDAHSRRRVRRLSQQPRGEAVVHAEEALGLDDVGDSVEAGFVSFGGASRAAHLHPVLDEVERLNEERRPHAGGTAENEFDIVWNGSRRRTRRRGRLGSHVLRFRAEPLGDIKPEALFG